MSKQTDIRNQMKEAMLAKDSIRLGVLRGLISAFTNENVANRRKPDEELSDEEVLAVIAKQAKQRKDSIEQFEKGGRPELAEAEKVELEILEAYLPIQMTEAEVLDYARNKQTELGITDQSKANQLLGAIMKDLKGRTDGNMVRKVVDSLFS